MMKRVLEFQIVIDNIVKNDLAGAFDIRLKDMGRIYPLVLQAFLSTPGAPVMISLKIVKTYYTTVYALKYLLYKQYLMLDVQEAYRQQWYRLGKAFEIMYTS